MSLFLSLNDVPSALPNYPIKGIELRIERYNLAIFEKIKAWLPLQKLPVIMAWKLPFDQEAIYSLLKLDPDYFDIDSRYDVSSLQRQFPKVKWIVSHHDFEKTPSNLEHVWQSMQKKGVAIYKIATMACSILDALRMCRFADDHPGVIALCMGPLGTMTRLAAPILGAPINYVSLPGMATAPGQLDLDEMFHTYYYDFISRDTKLYGLIGSPVSMSISHQTHNEYFVQNNVNGVYVKMEVQKEEVVQALEYMHSLPFEGLSVTTPLKEVVAHHINAPFPAVNTLKKENQWKSINSDGEAIVELLVEKGIELQDLPILILGAGGAALAIAQSLHAKGSNVYVWNRSTKNLERLIQRIGCRKYHPSLSYSVVIHATTIGFFDHEEETLLDFSRFLKGCQWAVEVVARDHTPFVVSAKQEGCQTILGRAMFLKQAHMQFAFWKKEIF